MINIPYKHGKMNIDIIKFLVNRNLNDIRYLCKNIIAISPNRLDIKNEICYTINAIRNSDIEKPKFYNPKYNERFEIKMTRMIEYLDKYIDVNGDESLWRCDQCKDTACCKGNFCPTCDARMKGGAK